MLRGTFNVPSLFCERGWREYHVDSSGFFDYDAAYEMHFHRNFYMVESLVT